MGFLVPIRHPLDASAGGVDQNKSIGGFLKNIPGDIGEFVTGLGALGGSVLNDVVGGVQEVVTLGRAEPEYKLGEIGRGIADLPELYAKNYGSWEGFKNYLYEDPLAFLGDILTVASAGGYGAAKGAQLAAKLPTVADDLARLQKGVSGLDDISSLARGVHRVLPGAGAGDTVPLAGYRPVLEAATGKVIPEPRHLNPYRRLLREGVRDRLLSHPIAPYADRAAQLAQEAELVQTYGQRTGLPVTAQAKQLGQESDFVSRIVNAAEEYNKARTPAELELTRVAQPRFGNYLVKKATDRLLGFHSTRFIQHRNEYMRELDDFFKTRKNVLSPQDIERFHVYAQIMPPKSYGRLTFEEITQDLAAGATRLGSKMAARLQPHMTRIEKAIAEGADNIEVESARRYVENLTERVGVEEAIARGDDVDPIAEAVSALRLWIDDRMSSPLMDADPGLLRYRTALDRSFLPTRLDERKILHSARDDVLNALEDDDIPDPEALAVLFPHDGGASFLEEVAQGADASDAIDSWIESLNEPGAGIGLDTAAKGMGIQAPLYFPHMDPKRIRTRDFLMGRRSRGGLTGIAPHLKQNKGFLYNEGRYVSDPVEAYSRRVAQVTKHLETYDMLESVVKRFGRVIAKHDDFDSDFEAVMHPGAARVILSTKMHVEREIAERISALHAKGVKMGAGGPEGIEDAFADGIEAGLRHTEQELVKAVEMGERLYAVPKVVADRLDTYTKLRLGQGVRMWWDAPINLWRSLVLAGSPRWVFYNLLGNITFLKMQGGRLSDVLRLAVSPRFKAKVQKLMEDAVPEDVALGIHTGFHHQQYVTHYGSAENTGLAQFYRWLQGTKGARAGKGIGDRVRKFNEGIEEVFRKAAFIEGLDHVAAARGVKGVGLGFFRSHKRLEELTEGGIDDDAARAALDEVNYFFNDYNALGPWERNVVRRFISPFYSFYKHITKLLVSYPIHSPVRFNVINNLAKLSQEMLDMGPVPEWLEGAVPTENFAFLGEQGSPMDVRFLNSRGINPFAALAQGPADFMFGQMNPILKLGYEQATGTNTLTGEPFTAPDIMAPFGSDQRYRLDPATMQVEPVNRVAPSIPNHILSMIPQFALGRDLVGALQGEAGSRYGTGQTINIPGTDVPQYPTDPLQELLQFVGLSTTDYNLPKYQIRRAQEVQDALKSIISRNPQLLLNR